MFSSRPYKAVSQDGDTDMESDNETAFFSTENGSKLWKIGMRPDDLNQDLALDLPYVHPTLPVETKKINYKSRYTRRQIVSGGCLLCLIISLIAAFAMTIIYSEKYMLDDVNPTDNVTEDIQSTPGEPNLLPTNKSGPPDSPQSSTTASGNTDTTTVSVVSTNGGLKSSQDISSITMPTDTLSTPVTDFVPNNRPSLQDSPTDGLSVTKVTVTTTTDSMSSGSASSTTFPMVHPSSSIGGPSHKNH